MSLQRLRQQRAVAKAKHRHRRKSVECCLLDRKHSNRHDQPWSKVPPTLVFRVSVRSNSCWSSLTWWTTRCLSKRNIPRTFPSRWFLGLLSSSYRYFLSSASQEHQLVGFWHPSCKQFHQLPKWWRSMKSLCVLRRKTLNTYHHFLEPHFTYINNVTNVSFKNEDRTLNVFVSRKSTFPYKRWSNEWLSKICSAIDWVSDWLQDCGKQSPIWRTLLLNRSASNWTVDWWLA